MRIKGTELDYEEHHEVALDHYMGGDTETKEEWANRVWNNCRRHSEGEALPRVYACREGQTWQQRAKELWDNKKKRRCESICNKLGLKDSKPETIVKAKQDSRYFVKKDLFSSTK